MSKRVLIILAVGLLAIVGAFFLHKHEVSQEYELPELETEPEAEKKVTRKNKKVDEPIKEETETGTATATEPGTETAATNE